MDTKIFPAFGYTVLRRKCAVGEVLTDEDYTNGIIEITEPWSTCWVVTKGLIHQTHLETSNVSVRPAGFNSIENREPAGKSRCEFIEDTTVFCVPGAQSKTLIDTLRFFMLGAGDSTTLPQGTKLSLFQGELSVGEKTIKELRQVEIKSGDKVVTAVEDCYGIIFP